ncbi:Oidioi.mRNA.OKI2018_I69.chr2.g4090.t1.cds [Oikopleura dioica]|uniref:Oidioi.mRNA.OKI2018_I69.chr2.g4090.t1.cds n=1 Tax=Oikopleura dioica TaxID=34765 RepID=A0ABN7T1P7_OIKDI|nr:Oidioi.mRNA.OKI2018_I69.chr2.g4090.t1.cds [Oikopleura dioica]
MKLAWSFAALASARLGDETALSEDRIWTADVTDYQAFTLDADNPTASWSVPVFPDASGYDRYLPNKYYRIYVTVPEKKSISVSFANFDVEEADVNGECNLDAAIIINGPDGNAELARYCGNDPKSNSIEVEPVFGTREDMTLVFKTNENTVVHRGFTATFTLIDLPENVLAWNMINNAFENLKTEVFNGHGHRQDHIQNKKSAHMQKIMERFVWMKDHSSVDPPCTKKAMPGTGDDFMQPTTDFSDPCAALGNFVDSIRTFHYAYVCMDGISLADKVPGETKKERRARKMKRPSVAVKMLHRQKKFLTDKKFHAMGCLL